MWATTSGGVIAGGAAGATGGVWMVQVMPLVELDVLLVVSLALLFGLFGGVIGLSLAAPTVDAEEQAPNP